MCGIAGLFNFGPSIASTGEAELCLRAMTDSLVHRGPDAEGIWVDPRSRCLLGNRRLSVIDVSAAGLQPMPSADGRWMVAFNGEIYNFQEIRQRLEDGGIRFHGHSDTEVLSNSIARWHTGALHRFDGMFAFAAFDTHTGHLLLARDPFGEKPLYYMELPGGGLAFASELQALERLPAFDNNASVETLAELLMFGYVGGSRSIYGSVRKLPPGHWLLAAPGQPLQIQRYFSFEPGIDSHDPRPLPELADELEEILVRSLRRRVIADVPLGAFLSGGVDSSTVCALMCKRLGLEPKTFSVGFAGAAESEHETARAFAQHLGIEHHERILVPSDIEALGELGKFLDEPNSDWSCLPVYMLSKLAREHVTVAISGDGGDEMFGGYSRYAETLHQEGQAALDVHGSWSAGNSYYSSGLLALDERDLVQLLGAVPPGLTMHLADLRDGLDQPSGSLMSRMRKTDVQNYLPGSVLAKVDRMSMQHSLEVRTPFLSVELARFAEQLPPTALDAEGLSKRVLREVAYRYLPRTLVNRPKLGFGLPNMDWGREQIRGVATRLLSGEDSRLRECLGGDVLDRLLARPRATHRWWALAMLESWCRYHPVKLPRIANEIPAALHEGRRIHGTA
jgi:asparagine synthase (glutamine-hydrolysing)